MKLSLPRILLLVAILGIGWFLSDRMGAAGNLGGMLIWGALFAAVAAIAVVCFIVSDYRKREEEREQKAQEQLLKEMSRMKPKDPEGPAKG